ncbi:MAG: hypothetical protein GDA40_11915 [Rhodobacteraceae bacterium]|nr:hypothetical protein [Paracoccaceae bacterium]
MALHDVQPQLAKRTGYPAAFGNDFVHTGLRPDLPGQVLPKHRRATAFTVPIPRPYRARRKEP